MSNVEPVIPKKGKSFSSDSLPENEIDLFELWEILINQRWLIIKVTCLVTLLAVIVSLLLPEVYRAEVVFSPALEKDIEQINIPEVKGTEIDYFYKITSEELYDEFIRNLNSTQLRLLFFKEGGIANDLKKNKDDNDRKIFEEEFSKKMVVKDTRFKQKNQTEPITITLDGDNEELIVKWLNDYISYLNHYTIRSVSESIKVKKQKQSIALEKEIERLRDDAKEQRFDNIEKLKEALTISDTIGENGQTDVGTGQLKVTEEQRLNINTVYTPLYERGSKALRAELKALEKRKNDDPFIPLLRPLQERLKFLAQITIAEKGINAVKIDRAAYVSNKQIKPKRVLIIVIGFLVGVVFAVFISVIKTKSEKLVTPN